MDATDKGTEKRVEVLVVEDSPTQAMELVHFLEGQGFATRTVANGTEALDAIARCKPAIAISDIVMPVMDGYELCRRMKRDGAAADVPVILLTSLSDPRDILKGIECGADNFIVKPYDGEYLVKRINYVLANRDLRGRERVQMAVEILFADEKKLIIADRMQILDLLLTSYETAVHKNLELGRTQDELRRLNEELEAKVAERTIALRTKAEENARLYAASEQRLSQLQALRHIDMAITASLDPRVTLDVFLTEALAQLHMDAGAVLLLDPDSLLLTVGASRNLKGCGHAANLRLGTGHAGKAAVQRRTLVVPDLRADPCGCCDECAAVRDGFVTYLAAPLVAKGAVKGVFELFHRQPFAPTDDWQSILDALAGQAAIAIDNAHLFHDLQRSNDCLVLAYDETIEGWARALDLRDKETEGHSRRVTDATASAVRAMGLDGKAQVFARRGALLHDIGKVGIPDAILLKPGPLNDDEWTVMRQHPEIAMHLLSPIAFLRPSLDIPYCHHEKWDGTGYPRGLHGDEIPLPARAFAVADVVDALSSDRPYRKAWPVEKVRDHVAGLAGTHFDPRCVEAFLDIAGQAMLLGSSPAVDLTGPRG